MLFEEYLIYFEQKKRKVSLLLFAVLAIPLLQLFIVLDGFSLILGAMLVIFNYHEYK
jgi:hypothetical protein